MKIQILDRTKKKKFIEGASSLGLSKVTELLIRSGSERIRAYSGNLSNTEIMDLWKILPIEGIGLYVGKDSVNRHGVREIRLSIDALHLWKRQITKNVLVLTKEQEEEWFKTGDVELEETTSRRGFIAVRSADTKDFLGTAKVSNDGVKLFGFLPKERRRKSNTV